MRWTLMALRADTQERLECACAPPVLQCRGECCGGGDDDGTSEPTTQREQQQPVERERDKIAKDNHNEKRIRTENTLTNTRWKNNFH